MGAFRYGDWSIWEKPEYHSRHGKHLEVIHLIPRSLNEQSGGLNETASAILGRALSTINCCVPGIVKAFDQESQTASVQPTVRRRIRTENGVCEMDYPLLGNVPVFFLGGGDYAMTFPVREGDECLVLFADSCIDAWWQSGDVQGQIVARQHDLSDGFAFVGFRSKPRVIQDFNGVIPELADMMLAGKKMSDWMAGVGDGAYFQGETLVLGSGQRGGEE